MNLQGKVALVTGSTSGIGKGIAEELSRSGAEVVILGLPTKEVAEAVASEIEAKTGNTVSGYKLDVSNEAEVVELINTISKDKNVDILVNNAGIQIIEPVDEFLTSEWKKLLSINLDGSFYMARECFKVMKESKKGGRIINIGSVHSFHASKDKAAYVTGKHALVGLTRSLAVEGGKYNIAANLVAPGFVMTDLVKKQIPERAEVEGITKEEVMKSMTSDTVDGKFTTVQEVAKAVEFFASAESNAYSGQSLIVSHGWNMR